MRVQSEGKKLKGKLLMVMAVRGAATESRLGITVSRRVGNAVIRNRVRRRVREIVREQFALLPQGWDLVVVAFPEAAGGTFRALQEDLRWLLMRARDLASSRRFS